MVRYNVDVSVPGVDRFEHLLVDIVRRFKREPPHLPDTEDQKRHRQTVGKGDTGADVTSRKLEGSPCERNMKPVVCQSKL
mmetsp:Transcript_136319/g.322940  ORF Transcript_136319/g.322940 Transcript_136319/m.322940 type:complete len:80 (+) Transcript_136319:625-864(+)